MKILLSIKWNARISTSVISWLAFWGIVLSTTGLVAQQPGIPHSGHRPVERVAFQPVRTPMSSVTSEQVLSQPTQPTLEAASSNSAEYVQRRTPLAPPSKDSRSGVSTSGSKVQSFVSVAASLMLVIGLFFGLAWFARNKMGGQGVGALPDKVLSVVGRVSVGPRQHLMLLQFGGKLVLCCQHQSEVRYLSEIVEPEEVQRLLQECGVASSENRGSRTISNSKVFLSATPGDPGSLLNAFQSFRPSSKRGAEA